MDNSRFTEMTTRPVPRLILSLAAPTILSMLVTSFYNLGDTFFVSRISTQATAAVGVSFAVMAVVQAIGFMLGHGSGNFVSRKLGARETEEASRMLATGFVYGVIAGILIAVLGHVFLKPLCVLLGSTPTILPYTEKYLGVIFLGTPLMLPSLEDLQIIGAWKILVLRPPSCKTSVAAALEICCRKDTVATSHTDSG